MPTYKYKAKRGPSDIIEGNIEAQSREEAVESLSQKGCHPLYIEEGTPTAAPPAASLGRARGNVKGRDITIFSRQLSSLLKSGVPILSALTIIAEQTEDRTLRAVLGSIRDSIKEGATFSSVLAKYPHIFSPLYVALVRTGESSGSLPESLYRIADYRAKQEEMFSRFRMALAYPALMAVVGIATVIFMLTFVMPRLMGIFTSMGRDLPLATQIVISVSKGLREWWFWIVVVLALFILILKRILNTEAGMISLSIFKLHVPVFGKFMLKAELARFSRTLEVLIRNGVPILKALDVVIPVLNNEIIKKRLRESYKELEQGGSLGKSLKKSKLFPLFMSNLIIVGEESGRLEEVLVEVANSYERDTDEAMRIMSSLLEPAMILIMGLIIGFIVIAMLLPVFEMNLMVR